MGDTAWSAAVRDHLHWLQRKITACGGRLVKTLGDGTLFTYGSARQALTCAQAIQRMMAGQRSEQHLGVRIGVHTGDLVAADEDVFGSVINKTARIAALAGAGEILLTDATRVMVGSSGGFQFSDPMSTPLKGLEGTDALMRLDWRGGL